MADCCLVVDWVNGLSVSQTLSPLDQPLLMNCRLSGSLGLIPKNSACVYQSSLSSMWGSGAYLISSLLQWYEALSQHRFEELLNEAGEMKSFQIHPI